MKLSTWHSNPDRPRRYHKPPILLRLEKSRGESQAADDGKNSPKGKIWHFRAGTQVAGPPPRTASREAAGAHFSPRGENRKLAKRRGENCKLAKPRGENRGLAKPRGKRRRLLPSVAAASRSP